MFYFYEQPQHFAMEQMFPFCHQRRQRCHPGQAWNCQRVPRHFGILDQLLEEAEKRVIAEQRQHQSMKEYFSAIESMAKAMMVENAQSGPKSDQTELKSDQSGPKPEDARPESDQSGSKSASQKQNFSMKDYLSAIESMVNAVLVEKEQSEEKSDQSEKKIEITKPESEKSVKKQVAKRFGSKVNINETMDKVEIIIELIGHKFNAEHLDVQVIDGNVLLVKAEDGDKKFERKFALSKNANVEKIESKFANKDEEKQILTVTIPKEVRIVQVPISMEE